MVADAVLKGALLGGGIVAVLGATGLWLWGRSDRRRVSLADAATDAWEGSTPPSATLSVEVDPDLAVSADPRKLRELFAALFENAVEHGSTGNQNSPSSGDVAEETSASHRTQSDDAVEHGSTSSRPSADDAGDGRDVQVRLVRTDDGFAVEDDGPGIPPADRERVFELGYTTRADRPGLGLGLVRTLCRAYGWEVAVAESEDGGARIVVSGVRFYSTWETDDGGD
ncbi:MAG: sensor histidine kinase [Halorientalis sp.]